MQRVAVAMVMVLVAAVGCTTSGGGAASCSDSLVIAGDSYQAGTKGTTPWPVRLELVGVDNADIAISGAAISAPNGTIPTVSSTVKGYLQKCHPADLVVGAGTNDAILGQHTSTITNAYTALTDWVHQYRVHHHDPLVDDPSDAERLASAPGVEHLDPWKPPRRSGLRRCARRPGEPRRPEPGLPVAHQPGRPQLGVGPVPLQR